MYRALIATGRQDAFDRETLDRVARDALGKGVFLMFAEKVGEVTGSGRGEDGVSVLFEAVESLIDDGKFYCVPSFVGGELSSFGLVPVPADSNLTPVEVVK